jgi:capsular exopolysaccharide synthesis family protein
MGVPVIAMIPKAGSGLATRLLPWRSSSKVDRDSFRRVGKHRYQLDSFDKPLIVEAFHQLRTSLLLSTSGGPKTVLVTSGEAFEGKTVTSLNLAKSLAQLGEKVLLIDADLRCPKMNVINDVDNSQGLSTLLKTNGIDRKDLEKAIQRDVEHNLDILPSGPKVPSPANLFGSLQMQGLLRQLGSIYSYVVIDSPPVLYFADSVILSTFVDAVVLIARANYGSREVLASARKRMQDVRANVVGIVVNDVPLSNYRYYKNGYYEQLEEAEASAAESSLLHLE